MDLAAIEQDLEATRRERGFELVDKFHVPAGVRYEQPGLNRRPLRWHLRTTAEPWWGNDLTDAHQ